MPVTLYRADSEHPRLNHASWWTPDLERARRYTRTLGFGGPIVYRAVVEPLSILDLRSEPWSTIAEQFGLDRDDYGPGQDDHEVIWDLSRVLGAGGYDWAVLTVSLKGCYGDEWLYVGETELTAERIEDHLGRWSAINNPVLDEHAKALTRRALRGE